MKKVFSQPLVVLIIAFVLAGCSGKSGSNKQNNMQDTSNAMQSGQSENMNSSTNSVHVYGINQMKFVVEQKGDNLQTGDSVTVDGNTYYMLNGITAKAGSSLTIKLTNLSKLPATAMSHNWCLLKMGTDAAAFSKAGASAKDNNYIASNMEDQVIKETGMVAGGNSKSITFTVPQKTGQYDYVCTFPGHYSSGMKGTLTVQ